MLEIARPDGLDLQELDQHVAELRPEAVQHPLVIEEALPGEDALAVALALQAQRQPQRLEPLVGAVGEQGLHQARGVGVVAGGVGVGERDQLADLDADELLHHLQVALGDLEVGLADHEAAPLQVLAQQEGIERGQFVQRLQHARVAAEVLRPGQVLQPFDPAALADEQRAAAETQVRALEGHDQLGGRAVGRPDRLGLVGAQPVLEDHRRVQRRGEEQGLGEMFGIVGVLDRQRRQVEHAAGRGGPFQAAHAAIGFSQGSLPIRG